MNFITALVASSLINLQQPVQPAPTEQTVGTGSVEQIAIDYLKLRFTDADFIQTTVVEKGNSKDFDVYLAFSADSTPVNTCMIHLHKNAQQTTYVESISCLNYQRKIGFKEKINTNVLD